MNPLHLLWIVPLSLTTMGVDGTITGELDETKI